MATTSKGMATTFTVYDRNTLLGTAYFRGVYDSQEAAQEAARQRARHCRHFVVCEVWTGTPQNYGRPTGFVVQGQG